MNETVKDNIANQLNEIDNNNLNYYLLLSEDAKLKKTNHYEVNIEHHLSLSKESTEENFPLFRFDIEGKEDVYKELFTGLKIFPVLIKVKMHKVSDVIPVFLNEMISEEYYSDIGFEDEEDNTQSEKLIDIIKNN